MEGKIVLTHVVSVYGSFLIVSSAAYLWEGWGALLAIGLVLFGCGCVMASKWLDWN
jgi:hypothetical protein